MDHGIQPFFDEDARCRRRTSLLAAAIALVLLAGFATVLLPPLRARVEAARAEARAGFLGPTRIEPRVRLRSPGGGREPLRAVGTVVPRAALGGGGGGRPVPAPVAPAPDPGGPHPPDLGEATRDLAARALRGPGTLRIFQSEDLVIERLVEPDYPEEMRDRGIEGRVSVLALVDTAGQVIDAEVLRASGVPQFDTAAESAVRQCRFRPYLEEGKRREVYAVFRFVFTLE